MIIVYSIYDFIFFPMYVLLILIILFFYKRTSGLSPLLLKHLDYGFLFRIIFCLLFFFMLQFYFGVGDSITYYLAIQDLHAMPWEVKEGFLTSPTATTPYGSA